MLFNGQALHEVIVNTRPDMKQIEVKKNNCLSTCAQHEHGMAIRLFPTYGNLAVRLVLPSHCPSNNIKIVGCSTWRTEQ